MDREKIEQEIAELQGKLNKVVEQIMQQSPVAQNLVGQITALQKMSAEEETCSDSESEN